MIFEVECFQRCSSSSPKRKKCFQRSFSRFPLFLNLSAPCVGLCRPGKRRCEYSSELVFFFIQLFFSFKAGRALPSLCAFSRLCSRSLQLHTLATRTTLAQCDPVSGAFWRDFFQRGGAAGVRNVEL